MHDDPDRDPLADARATLRALREAPTPEHVAVLLEMIDGEHARLVLLALSVERLEERGGVGVPAAEAAGSDGDLPEDPWPDWAERGQRTLELLVDMSTLELFKALRTLRAGDLREIVTVLVLDRMAQRAADEEDRRRR